MDVKTVTLAGFLLARIEDDESDASVLEKECGRYERERALNGADGRQGSIVADLLIDTVSSPARILADCEAKRRIVALHGDNDSDTACQSYAGNWSYSPCATLRALALPYADHPDYRQEWRP